LQTLNINAPHLAVLVFIQALLKPSISCSKTLSSLNYAGNNMYIIAPTTTYLLAIPTVLSAVTGELRAPVAYMSDRVQLCTDLRPTQCCRAIPGTLEYFKTLIFNNLPRGAISAAFRQSGNVKGWDGKILRFEFGSGDSLFQSRGTKITGGSYIVCPAHAEAPIFHASFLNSRCRAKRNVEGEVQMKERAEGGTPGEDLHVYADVVRINDTEYREDPKGSLYLDKDGVVLDMNLLRY